MTLPLLLVTSLHHWENCYAVNHLAYVFDLTLPWLPKVYCLSLSPISYMRAAGKWSPDSYHHLIFQTNAFIDYLHLFPLFPWLPWPPILWPPFLLLCRSPPVNSFVIKSSEITAPMFLTLQYLSLVITSSLQLSSFDTMLAWLDLVTSWRPCKRFNLDFISDATVSPRKSVSFWSYSSVFIDSGLEGPKAVLVKPISWLSGWIR